MLAHAPLTTWRQTDRLAVLLGGEIVGALCAAAVSVLTTLLQLDVEEPASLVATTVTRVGRHRARRRQRHDVITLLLA